MIQTNKKDYITILSVISCFSVLMLHANGCFWGDVNNSIWPLSNVIECLFYFAVPCFFMITGITLIDYRDKYDTKTYFKRRIFKTLIPYLFFTIVVLTKNLIAKGINKEPITAKYIIDFIITGGVPTYWFFLPLFVLYLIIPLISLVDKTKRLKICKYLFAILFATNSLLPFINSVSDLNISNPFTNTVFGPLMYACLGYIVSKTKQTNTQNIIMIFLGVGGLLTHLLGTYFLTIQIGKLNDMFKGYNTPQTLAYSLSILLLCKNYLFKMFRFKKVEESINFLSKYTFSIYLLHQFCLNLLATYVYGKLFNVMTNSPIYIFTVSFMVIPICIVITWIARHIPLTKYLLP